MASAVGYSGTPLARKLGITAGMRVHVGNAPADYMEQLEPLPQDVEFVGTNADAIGLYHLFHTQRTALEADLRALRSRVARGEPVWVSWPKKSAPRARTGVATDVTEDVIRAVALPLGFVDIKVCAVNAVWSGLKLVVRKELRA